MTKEFTTAIEAAIEAGKAILTIYDSAKEIEITSKMDNSPLTEADLASNTVINSYLSNSIYPIISEENKEISSEVRKSWTACWIVDPLDGTKEFIKKNGEFTVNIALCKAGKPIFGVIYVPVYRELYYGIVEERKAFRTNLDDKHNMMGSLFDVEDLISPSTNPTDTLRIVGSRSHMNEETKAYMRSMKDKYSNIDIISKGSSLKFCLVAQGKADVYPRFAPTMEWDTAAGHAICNAVGLTVTSTQTNAPLLYNKENLLNPHFIVHH